MVQVSTFGVAPELLKSVLPSPPQHAHSDPPDVTRGGPASELASLHTALSSRQVRPLIAALPPPSHVPHWIAPRRCVRFARPVCPRAKIYYYLTMMR